MRYIIQIRFKNTFQVWDIEQPVKTLKEAHTYKSSVDNTVANAQLFDTVKNSVREVWL